MQDGIFHLKDGRRLGYTEAGDPEGTPVFFFHGTPGSRRMRHHQPEIAVSRSVRLISADRPGFGLSDFQPDRSFLDWAEDVAQLADHLRINQFRIAAFSGGGPYALACAHQWQSRVKAIALISSVGPLQSCLPKLRSWPVQFAFQTGKRASWLLRHVTEFAVAKARKNFDRSFEWAASRLPQCDRNLILRNEIRAIFRESLTEAFRNGSAAFLWEVKLLTLPWGFPLDEIRQPIVLWHGDLDAFSNARPLAMMLPNCKATFLAEGHMVFFNHWAEILDQLLLI